MVEKKKEVKKKAVTKKPAVKKKNKLARRPSDIRNKVLEMKMEFPEMTQKAIGIKLGLTRGAVEKHLNAKSSKSLFDKAEENMRNKLVGIREKAMQGLEDMVNGFVMAKVHNADNKLVDLRQIVPPQVRASMIKFALEAFINKNDELQPESIEFETIISPTTGVIEQTVKKSYKKVGSNE